MDNLDGGGVQQLGFSVAHQEKLSILEKNSVWEYMRSFTSPGKFILFRIMKPFIFTSRTPMLALKKGDCCKRRIAWRAVK